MAQPKLWVDEIVEALEDLGGEAKYQQLYDRIRERGQMNFEANKNWQAAIRQNIEFHSSDSAVFKPEKGDLFYSVAGLGKGRWGLRSRVPQTPAPIDNSDLVTQGAKPASQVQQTTYRYLRDTKLARELKASYGNKCQLCDVQIGAAGFGTYAEAHHIQPLGRGGPDVKENLIVLCPNHHAEFDYGGLAIDPESFEVVHLDSDNPVHGRQVKTNHELSKVYLEFHMEEIFNQGTEISQP